MGKAIVTVLGFCLAALLLCEAASQQTPESPSSKRAEFIKKYDKNGDGKLDKAEWDAARKSHQAELLKRYDKNGNGKIDDDEREAPREEFRKQGAGENDNRKPPEPKKEEEKKEQPS
jgi:hypothetical protein